MQKHAENVKIRLLISLYLQEKFILCDYMVDQPNLNTNMRAILVDWLVEVQVS